MLIQPTWKDAQWAEGDGGVTSTGKAAGSPPWPSRIMHARVLREHRLGSLGRRQTLANQTSESSNTGPSDPHDSWAVVHAICLPFEAQRTSRKPSVRAIDPTRGPQQLPVLTRTPPSSPPQLHADSRLRARIASVLPSLTAILPTSTGAERCSSCQPLYCWAALSCTNPATVEI